MNGVARTPEHLHTRLRWSVDSKRADPEVVADDADSRPQSCVVLANNSGCAAYFIVGDHQANKVSATFSDRMFCGA